MGLKVNSMNNLSDVFSIFSVKDKVVLITGAGRGIGRGIARIFGSAGAKVAINALTDRYAAPLVREINESGGQAFLVLGDLTQSTACDAVVAKVLEHFGKLEVLINNLGDAIFGPVTELEGKLGMSDEAWKRVVDINLTHAFYCSRAAGKEMLKQGFGKVINISSFAAVRGGSQLAAYTAAKSGLVGLTRALALEWAPAIQVNSIAPGIFPDEENMKPEELQARDTQARDTIPLQRVGRPREVGYLALYLASAASDYITGQTIYIDGGLTVK